MSSSDENRCRRGALWTGAAGTAVVLAGQIFSYPSDVRDAATGAFPAFARLSYPTVYALFAPFFQFADHFTLLSIGQHEAFFAFANAAWLIGRFFPRRSSVRWLREAAGWLLFNLVYFAAAAVVVLVPRPMAKLALSDPDLLAMDSHSHTSYSWDARKSFTPERNIAWHERAGFQAAFITDHNGVEGALEARELFVEGEMPPDTVPMRGEEVSLFKSHWALIGNETLLPNGKYDRGMEGIQSFLNDVRKSTGMVVIASLPEYWRYHWDDLEKFVSWGADGFEIVSAAPQALDFPHGLKLRMVEFCRQRNLIMTGISDSHGWGSTNCAWNVVRVPGWRKLAPEDLERAVIAQLQAERFKSVQVLERVRADMPDREILLAFDPVRQAWEAARSLPRVQAANCLAWLWVPFLVSLRKSRREG